ncbi:transcriptional regulator [Pedococcus cremeus]|uniref:Transcriptional regulator n=1 Tax=Pedococcus cremeus TaxID=587636 RepID=A0A1H9WZ76_9MICO|nr:helix-turn-helix domain-containing protein [Pedococcus cremeus]SES39258.1 transcriptional regulator [Pedococcus cremeus]
MFIAGDERQDAAAQPQALESRTRDRVLQAISERGPITAGVLADQLGLTAAAVRRHLDNLVELGLITGREAAAGNRGRGRPARAYVVSDAGHQSLESDYDHLATEALRFLADAAGEEAVTRFAQQRVAELEERYAAELAEAGSDRQARTAALVKALTRDGFAASARPVGDAGSPGALTGIQLCQGHCPVQHVAREFPQFCDAETDAFSRLLGVHVQRLATLAHGDHVCTTFVPTPTVRAAGPAPASTRTATTRTTMARGTRPARTTTHTAETTKGSTR